MATVPFEIQVGAIGEENVKKLAAQIQATEDARKKLQATFQKAGLSEAQAGKAASKLQSDQQKELQKQIEKAKNAETDRINDLAAKAKSKAATQQQTFDFLQESVLGLTAGATLLGAAFGGVFLKIGSMAFEAAKFKADTMRALTYAEGSAKEAAKTYSIIAGYSNLSGNSRQSIAQALISVRQAGFNRKDSEDILAAAQDVTQRGGQGGAFAAALTQLKVKERLDSQTLSQIASAINDPFFEKEFLRAVGKSRGLKVDTAIQIESVKGLLDSNQIKEKEGLNAILSLVQKRVTKVGDLGAASIDGATDDWDKQVTRLKERFSNLLQNVPIKPFIDAVSRIATALDPATETGAKFAKIFEDGFAAVGGWLEGALTPENITAVFTTIKDVLGGVKDGFTAFINAAKPGFEAFAKALGEAKPSGDGLRDTLTSIGRAAGQVVGGIAKLAGWFASLGKYVDVLKVVFAPAILAFEQVSVVLNLIGAAFNAVKSVAEPVISFIGDKIEWISNKLGGVKSAFKSFFGLGEDLATGLKGGWAAKAQEAIDLARDTSAKMEAAVREETQTHSPSRVFAKIGTDLADGLNQGFVGGVEEPDIGPLMKGAKGAKADGPSGRPGNVFNITINADAGTVSDPVVFEAMVRDLFERVATEMGT